MRMPPAQALALRRVVIVALALASTLVAHALSAGGMTVRPAAPVAWLGLLCVVAVAGPRRRWRPRGVLRTLGVTAGLQAAAHLLLTAAPWALGLTPEHAGHAVAGPQQVVPHAAAALLIALLVSRLELWLGRVAELARRVRRWFAPAPGPASSPRPVTVDRPGSPGDAGPAVHPARGPPLLRTA